MANGGKHDDLLDWPHEEPCIMCGVVDDIDNMIDLCAIDEELQKHLPGYVESDGEECEADEDDMYIAEPVHAHKECLRKYQQTAWQLRNLRIEAITEAHKARKKNARKGLQ